MMSTLFPALNLNKDELLPSFTVSELNDWALITMIGADKNHTYKVKLLAMLFL